MLDGRADLYALLGEHELSMATLEAVRPVLETRGTPTRRFAFYHVLAMGPVIRRRYRVEEADLAHIRASLAAAAQGDDEKDVAYAAHFTGWLLWLHDDLDEAREHIERALVLAERIGEAILLAQGPLMLMLTALRRRDAETVRALLPRALAAAEATADPACRATIQACRVWLAWQDRCPEDVITLSGTIAATFSCEWVYLWPLIAVRLDAGDVAAAVAGARQLLQPDQQRLPDELDSAVAAACLAWDRDEPEAARRHLAGAVALARELYYL
jgi:hypothetical protein